MNTFGSRANCRPSQTYQHDHTKLRSKRTKIVGKNCYQDLLGEMEEFDEFLVINVETVYDVLLGRPWMHKNAMSPPRIINVSNIHYEKDNGQ